MKKTFIFIALTLACSILSTSCSKLDSSDVTGESDITIEETDSTQEARKLMSDWQI